MPNLAGLNFMKENLKSFSLAATVFTIMIMVFVRGSYAVPSISEVTVTDVTTKSFSVVWISSEASKPDVKVFDDPEGQHATEGITLTPHPIEGKNTEIVTQAEDNGVMKVRITGLMPEHTYYFQTVTTSKITGEITHYPGATPFLSVTTEKATTREKSSGDSIVPFSNNLLIKEFYLEDGKTPASGTLAVVNLEGASYPLSSFIGDGVVSPYAVFDLNNIYSAKNRASIEVAGGEILLLNNYRGIPGKTSVFCVAPLYSTTEIVLSFLCDDMFEGTPEDGAKDVPVVTGFSWNAIKNVHTYSLYLWRDGEEKPDLPVASDLTEPMYTLNASLHYGALYHWQITVKGTFGEIMGPQWSFTTFTEDGDIDNDGLSNSWEVENGLDPFDDGSINSNNGPEGDIDGDGISNREEFLFINLCHWTVIEHENDLQPGAIWEINAECASVTQTADDSKPSLFLGNFDITHKAVEGSMKVNDSSSDDAGLIGFAFAYQGEQQYYLFEWQKEVSNEEGRGMSLTIVTAGENNADVTMKKSILKSENTRILKQNSIGWKESTEYTYCLEFHPGRFRIQVRAGSVVLETWDITDSTFTFGRFGFYNSSQKDAVYYGMKQTIDRTETITDSHVFVSNRAMGSNGSIAEEDAKTGMVETLGSASSELELTSNADENKEQIVGIRFSDVNVPQGATITGAFIQFESRADQSGPVTLTIKGEDHDNALLFKEETGNVSLRQRTEATVNWSINTWNKNEAGAEQKTPDLKNMVQEIVDKKEWKSGNALSFIIISKEFPNHRTAGNGAADGPVLTIEFSAETHKFVSGTAVARAGNIAEEDKKTGSVLTLGSSSSDLELTSDADENKEQVVGIRFPRVDVPQGVRITNAHIQFKSHEDQGGQVEITTKVEKHDDAPLFRELLGNVTTRQTTNTSAKWSPGDWNTGDAGEYQQTPNLKSIVQEIIDRSSWWSHNAMAFVFDSSDFPNHRTAKNDAADGPVLTIEYRKGEEYRYVDRVVDENPPLCNVQLDEENPTLYKGIAEDMRESEDINRNEILDAGEDLNGNGNIDKDTGIFIVKLAKGAENVDLSVEEFTPGDGSVGFIASVIDSNNSAHGVVEVTDGGGNTCQSEITYGAFLLVNEYLTGTPDPESFLFDPTPVVDGPKGTFSFDTIFCNISEKTFADLKSVTTVLTDGNVLLNREEGTPKGVGSELFFPLTGDFADGLLSPGECITVHYEIGLGTNDPFDFSVDVYGTDTGVIQELKGMFWMNKTSQPILLFSNNYDVFLRKRINNYSFENRP